MSNYRERFVTQHKDIFMVFKMYCKRDFYDQFVQTDKSEITLKEFKELFRICMTSNSHKVGMLIFTLYLDPLKDIDDNCLNIMIQTVKTSNEAHEMKLFYLLNNFD